eukprot:TRINITY_DN2733_c0_g1_i4.p2 TRINITY_DN2733_c0_g1~~TRINITY_DN2733_c0_g1_i4.p2  ORF type:complete len:164 (-),score=16.86 TRINITY_DN2733_c0_g1_i4:405-896(-)
MLSKKWTEQWQQKRKDCKEKLQEGTNDSNHLQLLCQQNNNDNVQANISSCCQNKSRLPTEFELRVYQACCMIPEGKVSTYGDLAKFIGSSPRAVGQALKRNPFAPQVPCHRVVAASLDLGGYSGQWGIECTKVQKKHIMLQQEGVEFIGMKISPSSLWLPLKQ